MKIFKQIALTLALVLGLVAGNVQALMLDDFSTGEVINTPFPSDFFPGHLTLKAPNNETDTGTQTGSMLGGSRQVDYLYHAGTDSGNIVINKDAGFQVNNGSNLRSTATVTYNFSATDFRFSGERGMELYFPGVVNQTMDLIIQLSDGTNTAENTSQYNTDNTGFTGSAYVSFDEFINADITNFNALTSAVLIITSPVGVVGLDTGISFFRSIPEPGSLLLLLSGLFAGLMVKRKKSIFNVLNLT